MTVSSDSASVHSRLAAFLQTKKAVVFDLDGTLLDSLNMWNAVDVQLAAELGRPGMDAAVLGRFREEALRRHNDFAGNPYTAFCGDFGRMLGSTRTAQDIHHRRYEISRVMLAETVTFREGAAGVVKAFKAMGKTVALATTTRRENVDIYAEKNAKIASELDFKSAFEFMLTKDEVSRIKPDPEVYLMALSKLGLAADEVVVIEDSLTGITAARAAGIDVIIVEEENSVADTDRIKPQAQFYFESPKALLESLNEAQS